MEKTVWQQLRGRIGAKSIPWLILLGACGLLLVSLSGLFSSDDNKTSGTASYSVQAYTAALEQRLADIVGGIQGAGECRVMVTLENGVEYLYATEQKINSSRAEKNDGSDVSQADTSQDSVILIDTDNGKQGLLVTEIQPTVKGVVVVCSGGDKAAVQQQIVKAVSTVLDIAASRVCVTKLS